MTVMTSPDADRDAGAAFADFEAFVHARGRSLWATAWLLTRDAHRAEDLVQAALTKTYGRFDALNRPGHSYEAYVRRTLYTTHVGWWRQTARALRALATSRHLKAER